MFGKDGECIYGLLACERHRRRSMHGRVVVSDIPTTTYLALMLMNGRVVHSIQPFISVQQ